MTTSYIIDPIESRWNEAVKNPSIPRWKTLADMASQMANALAESNPENIMVVAHRAIYHEARARMLAMEPARETA